MSDAPDPAPATPVATNIVRAEGHVDSAGRRSVLGHGPATVWCTGLSGSGKSTVTYAVEAALAERGVAAYVLDGDNVRFGLNADLGFAPEDRAENIRRIGHVTRLFHDAGLVVLSSFISPYRSDRDAVRALHPDGGFHEVFVDTPLEVCEARDVKGLYARARAGDIPDFSGISAPYEEPEQPELRLDTSTLDLEACVAAVLAHLDTAGVFSG
jgi:adenylylsulfate kinase